MMNTIIYTVYAEGDEGAQTSLTPAIVNFYDIDTGIDLTADAANIMPAIGEIGSGFYKFSYEWTTQSASGYLVKIDMDTLGVAFEIGSTGRYATLRIEKQDNLANVAARIETSSTSLETSSELLRKLTNRLLNVELGTWEIDSATNKLILKATTYEVGDGVLENEVLAEFDLVDSNNLPTTANPFKRLSKAASLEPLP